MSSQNVNLFSTPRDSYKFGISLYTVISSKRSNPYRYSADIQQWLGIQHVCEVFCESVQIV